MNKMFVFIILTLISCSQTNEEMPTDVSITDGLTGNTGLNNRDQYVFVPILDGCNDV